MELVLANPVVASVVDSVLGTVEVDDNAGGVVLDAEGEAELLEVDEGFGDLVGFGGWVGCVGAVDPLLDEELDDGLE